MACDTRIVPSTLARFGKGEFGFLFCTFLHLLFYDCFQVKQDPYPEETANYTLRLVKTRDARIDVSRSKASVVVVSSDHPYGIVEFDGDTSYNISEDFGHVSLSVVRNKGNTGKLLITINVFSSGATENVDFEVRPKGNNI